MDRGTYAAASDGAMQLRKLDIVANNLANTKTAGFKKQILVGDTESFDQTLASLEGLDDPYAKYDQERTPNVTNNVAVTDFSLGAIEYTNNPLNVALKNEDEFFQIQGADGETLYTRAGNFTLNKTSQLVDADGHPVLGGGGSISATSGKIEIAQNGSVLSDGEAIGRISVVRISDLTKLERAGGNAFRLKENSGATAEEIDADLVTNSLEMSNVSAVNSILDLITAQRGFQLYTQTSQSIDQMNQIAISKVGTSK